MLPHAKQDPDGSDVANDQLIHSQSERVCEDDHDQKAQKGGSAIGEEREPDEVEHCQVKHIEWI